MRHVDLEYLGPPVRDYCCASYRLQVRVNPSTSTYLDIKGHICRAVVGEFSLPGGTNSAFAISMRGAIVKSKSMKCGAAPAQTVPVAKVVGFRWVCATNVVLSICHQFSQFGAVKCRDGALIAKDL